MRHAFISPAMRRQLNTALYVKHTKPDASAPQGTPAAMAVFRRMDRAFMNLTKGARPRVRRRALARMVEKTK